MTIRLFITQLHEPKHYTPFNVDIAYDVGTPCCACKRVFEHGDAVCFRDVIEGNKIIGSNLFCFGCMTTRVVSASAVHSADSPTAAAARKSRDNTFYAGLVKAQQS